MTARALWILLVACLAGCKACAEDPVPPPGPDPVLRWHAHLGRPAASTSLVATLVHTPLDVKTLLASALVVPDGVYEVIDLVQPVDLMQLEHEGGKHMLGLYFAAANAHDELDEKYKLEPVTPGNFRIEIDGETRCMLMETRIACADSPRGMGSMVLFASRRAAKWKDDHTDAVIEMSGAVLREDVPSAALERIFSSLVVRVQDSSGVVPPGLAGYAPKLDFGVMFAGVERAAVRVRMTAKGAAIDARIDSAADATGAVAEITRAARKAKPLEDAAQLLPHDANVALAFAGATPAGMRRLVYGAMAAPLAGQESAKELGDQLAALWATTGGAYAVAQRFGELYEIHGLHDRGKTEAALGALTGRKLSLVDDAGGALSVEVSALNGGVAIAMGATSYVMAIVGERLVVIAGREVEPALEALRRRAEVAPNEAFLRMAKKPFVISADVGVLYARERARVDFDWAEGVPDAAELRASLSLELSGSAVRLAHGILRGTVAAKPTDATGDKP